MDFLQLAGKSVLIFGIANKKSVAFHVAKVLEAAGCELLLAVRSETRRESVRKLFPNAAIFLCDVEHQDQIDRLRSEVVALGFGPREPQSDATQTADGTATVSNSAAVSSSTTAGGSATASNSATAGRALAGVVHSVAFADYSAGWLPFHETPRRAFLQAVDVSCYSFIAIANAFKDLVDRDHGSFVTISISTTRMAAENYGYMAPIKAALDSSICFLAKSFSKFSRIRFNAVCPGLLKSSASAGIPGYVESYLHAEQATLRKDAVRTEEVANAVAFLISPRSSGINTQGIVVDAGMSVNYFDETLVRATQSQL